MGKPQQGYPEEFRREAVEYVRSSDKTTPQVAEDLGAAPQTLRNWIRQAEVDEGRRGSPPSCASPTAGVSAASGWLG